VAEQAERMAEVLLIAEAFEALARELRALGGFFAPADVAQHFRAPAVSSARLLPESRPWNSSDPRASGAGSFAPFRSSARIEEHFAAASFSRA